MFGVLRDAKGKDNLLMKDIAIFGAGGFGREVACLIRSINECIDVDEERWNFIGFFDDVKEKGFKTEYGEVIGGTNALNEWKSPLALVIAIGSQGAIKAISGNVRNPNVYFPNIVAPNVFFFDQESVIMGKGNIITFSCRLSCNVHIGDFNVLNGSVSFGHDVVIGSYNVIFPETRLSGCVSVGNENFFGARTFVAQGLKIGNHTRVGAGSVVLRNTKDGALYMGNPAKKVEI